MRMLFLLLFLFSTSIVIGQNCPDNCEISVPAKITTQCEGIDCDLLKVESNCTFKKYALKVYNRWGNIVYESDNVYDRLAAEDVEEAVYFWEIKATMCNGNKRTERGYVTVLN